MKVAINGFGRIGRNFFRAAKVGDMYQEMRKALKDADLKDLEWRGDEAATMDELLGRLCFEKISERIPRWR